MNKLLAQIFKYYKPNFAKLQSYGFTLSNGVYNYSIRIMGGQFVLNIKVTSDDIDTQVIDLATDEPYTLFLADGAIGSFVGAMRTEYESVMSDIAVKCFDKCVFKSEYAQELIHYVANTYGDELEYLWSKFPDNAIWRRKDNKKWYGILLTVTKSKLGLPSDERVEIIDLRLNTENPTVAVDGKTVFAGYHMNKKHWITMCLDGSVPINDIIKLLDISYELARKSKT